MESRAFFAVVYNKEYYFVCGVPAPRADLLCQSQQSKQNAFAASRSARRSSGREPWELAPKDALKQPRLFSGLRSVAPLTGGRASASLRH